MIFTDESTVLSYMNLWISLCWKKVFRITTLLVAQSQQSAPFLFSVSFPCLLITPLQDALKGTGQGTGSVKIMAVVKREALQLAAILLVVISPKPAPVVAVDRLGPSTILFSPACRPTSLELYIVSMWKTYCRRWPTGVIDGVEPTLRSLKPITGLCHPLSPSASYYLAMLS